MKPYYQDDYVTIYHGDCRELVSKWLYHVVITDPPYGVDFEGKKTKHTKVASGGYTVPDCSKIGPEVISSALKFCNRMAVFPGTNNLQNYPKADDIGCVFCPSGAGIGKWGFTCFHPILFYGQRPSSVLKPTSISSFSRSDSLGHPCPKPVEWMRWLINLSVRTERENEHSALPNETILDPFMGSGTTLVAAKERQQRAIGIEIEEKYCEIAARRLQQEVLPFAQPVPEVHETPTLL